MPSEHHLKNKFYLKNTSGRMWILPFTACIRGGHPGRQLVDGGVRLFLTMSRWAWTHLRLQRIKECVFLARQLYYIFWTVNLNMIFEKGVALGEFFVSAKLKLGVRSEKDWNLSSFDIWLVIVIHFHFLFNKTKLANLTIQNCKKLLSCVWWLTCCINHYNSACKKQSPHPHSCTIGTLFRCFDH